MWIDFQADPQAIAAAAVASETPTFHVVGPADGIDASFEGMSGDEIICRHFRNYAGIESAEPLIDPSIGEVVPAVTSDTGPTGGRGWTDQREGSPEE